MNQTIKAVLFWAVIVVSALLLWQVMRTGTTQGRLAPEISYSQFLAQVADGQVSSVTIAGNVLRGNDTKGGSFRVIVPSNQGPMMDALQQHKVEIWFREAPEQGWPNWILNLAPLVLLGALWFFMIRRMRRPPWPTQGASGSDSSQGSQPRFGP